MGTKAAPEHISTRAHHAGQPLTVPGWVDPQDLPPGEMNLFSLWVRLFGKGM